MQGRERGGPWRGAGERTLVAEHKALKPYRVGDKEEEEVVNVPATTLFSVLFLQKLQNEFRSIFLSWSPSVIQDIHKGVVLSQNVYFDV